jgi:hypothetical protein
MKIQVKEPPRTFSVGTNKSLTIKDMGRVHLEADEQLTFITESGANYDFVRKKWGFYATPSINGRLVDEGFKTALVQNRAGRIYIMVVEDGMATEFDEYCKLEGQMVLQWLNLHPLRSS